MFTVRNRVVLFAMAWALMLYGRSLSWGYLGFDDRWYAQGPLAGSGLKGVAFAFTSSAYARRYMPIPETVLALTPATSNAQHRVAVALYLVFAGLFAWIAYESGGIAGFLLGMAYLSSPSRLEVVSWVMGPVYVIPAIFALLAWRYRESNWGIFYAGMALLSYPQAAGAVALLGVLGAGGRRWLYWGMVVASFVGQFAERIAHGFEPLSFQWKAVIANQQYLDEISKNFSEMASRNPSGVDASGLTKEQKREYEDTVELIVTTYYYDHWNEIKNMIFSSLVTQAVRQDMKSK